MSEAKQYPYTRRMKRKSFLTVAMIGGLFVFVIITFGILHGAGKFVAGS